MIDECGEREREREIFIFLRVLMIFMKYDDGDDSVLC